MKHLVPLLLFACAHAEVARPAREPCPSKPACLTVMKCDYDADRGCDICVCSVDGIERGAEPPPGQPPFQR